MRVTAGRMVGAGVAGVLALAAGVTLAAGRAPARAGAGGGRGDARPSVAAPLLDYPAPVAPASFAAGDAAANWADFHLQGWKWCIDRHLRAEAIDAPPLLGGNPAQAAGFAAGHACCRAQLEARIAELGEDAVRARVRGLVLLHPELHSLSWAPPRPAAAHRPAP